MNGNKNNNQDISSIDVQCLSISPDSIVKDIPTRSKNMDYFEIMWVVSNSRHDTTFFVTRLEQRNGPVISVNIPFILLTVSHSMSNKHINKNVRQ
jgi:hypothetical protein